MERQDGPAFRKSAWSQAKTGQRRTGYDRMTLIDINLIETIEFHIFVGVVGILLQFGLFRCASVTFATVPATNTSPNHEIRNSSNLCSIANGVRNHKGPLFRARS